ncbi:hypothetical protein Tco_0983754 [Tanacetum coccineum]
MGKALLELNGGSCGGKGGSWGSITSGRGSGCFAKCSIDLNVGCGGGGLAVLGDGAGGGEVKGGGVNLGVFKRCSGENRGRATGEVGGDSIGVEGGAVW